MLGSCKKLRARWLRCFIFSGHTDTFANGNLVGGHACRSGVSASYEAPMLSKYIWCLIRLRKKSHPRILQCFPRFLLNQFKLHLGPPVKIVLAD